MDQESISADRSENRSISVSAPHEWDGIGQALRCAYESHRQPPRELTDVMHALDCIS